MRPDGRLTLSERFRFLRQAVVRRLRLVSVVSRPLDPELVAEVELPGDPLVEWAHSVCCEVSAPWLVNHCLRTWVWGAALARRDGLRFDPALAATGCLLHDLGLTAAHLPTEEACFAVHGADEAVRRLLARGESPARAHRIGESIALHLELDVARELPEARVVHEGAAFDVIGARFWEIGARARDTTLSRYPRLGLKREVSAALGSAAKRAPHSRIALLARLGFMGLIARAPFDERRP
jgi:hypothetical protein